MAYEVVGSERGTRASREGLRRPMGHLASFMHAFDFIHATAQPERITALPEHAVGALLGCAEREFRVYLADQREHEAPGAGEAITGTLTVRLPPGSWRVCAFSPVSGGTSPGIVVSAPQGTLTFDVPSFIHDLALTISAL